MLAFGEFYLSRQMNKILMLWALGSMLGIFSFSNSTEAQEDFHQERLWGSLRPQDLQEISESSFYHSMIRFNEAMEEEAQKREIFRLENWSHGTMMLNQGLPYSISIILEFAKRRFLTELPLRDAPRRLSSLRQYWSSDPMGRMNELAARTQERNRGRVLRLGQSLYGKSFGQNAFSSFMQEFEGVSQSHIDRRNQACGPLVESLSQYIPRQAGIDSQLRSLGSVGGIQKSAQKDGKQAFSQFMRAEGRAPRWTGDGAKAYSPLAWYRYLRLKRAVTKYDMRPGFFRGLFRWRPISPRWQPGARTSLLPGEVYRYPWRDLILPGLFKSFEYGAFAVGVKNTWALHQERIFFESIGANSFEDWESMNIERLESKRREHIALTNVFSSDLSGIWGLFYTDPSHLSAQEIFSELRADLPEIEDAEKVYRSRLMADIEGRLEDDLWDSNLGALEVLMQDLNPESAGASWAIAAISNEPQNFHEALESNFDAAIKQLRLVQFEMQWERDPDVLLDQRDVRNNTAAGWRWREEVSVGDLPEEAFEKFRASLVKDLSDSERYEIWSELMFRYAE